MAKSTLKSICAPFGAIQKRAACLISGAFRTTAAEALNTKLYLLPVPLQIEKLVKEAAIRLRIGPIFAIPSTIVRRRTADDQLWAG